MAEFTATVYQNEFLPDGGTDVNAIVTVDLLAAPGWPARPARATPARSSSSTPRARWAGPSWRRPRSPPSAAVDQIVDGT